MQLVGRDKIEREFSSLLASLNATKRSELLEIVGDPPDPRRVPESWWRRYEDEIAALLLLLLLTSSRDSAVQHGLDDRRAAELAAGWSGVSSREFATNWTTTTRDRLSGSLASTDVLTPEKLIEITDPIFGEARGEGAIVTEVTRGAVWGGETAVRIYGGISARDLWKTNPHKSRSGVCNLCRPWNQRPRVEWSAVYPEGPPIHPYCVCEILYVALGQVP